MRKGKSGNFADKTHQLDKKINLYNSYMEYMLANPLTIRIIKLLHNPIRTMTTYFILDRNNNTWSDQHYPLSSILSTPGITGEHILANARTQQTLTVAQARAMGARPRTTATKPAPAAKSATSPRPAANKSVTLGTSLNRDKKATPLGDRIPLASLTKKNAIEYKTLSQNDRIFNGRFTPQSLQQALNNLAQKGWRVISSSTATTYDEQGLEKPELIVLLERNNA